jgi:hypothetical protein
MGKQLKEHKGRAEWKKGAINLFFFFTLSIIIRLGL